MAETETLREGAEKEDAPSVREALLALAAEFEREANSHDSDLLTQAFMRAAVMASDRARALPPSPNGTREALPFAAATTPEPGSTPSAGAAPEGEFSRVELPGYVSWTGWVTEETFAGAGVLVVRDISGTVLARVSASAFRQVIPLPLPKPGDMHYDGQLALTAGDEAEDAWADDLAGDPF